MNDEPRTSAEEMLERLAPMLSRRQRLRGIAALLGGSTGAVFITMLWATEPGPLPERTSLSFALLLLVCLAWTGYGTWLTMRRAPLFALDQVIAAWLALAAVLLTTTVLVTVAAIRGRGLILALVLSAVLITVTVLLAVRAHARRTALLRRKEALTHSNPR